MNVEHFYEAYLSPFSVDGQNLYDLEHIHPFYREKMLACYNISEMLDVTRKFGFFTIDAQTKLVGLVDDNIFRIKEGFNRANLCQCELSTLAPIIAPQIMLQAHLIAKKLSIPEYYAAFQYVVSFLREKEKEITKHDSNSSR